MRRGGLGFKTNRRRAFVSRRRTLGGGLPRQARRRAVHISTAFPNAKFDRIDAASRDVACRSPREMARRAGGARICRVQRGDARDRARITASDAAISAVDRRDVGR
jgi:hypothetical protein